MTSNAETYTELTENNQNNPSSKANGTDNAKKKGKSRSWTFDEIIKRALRFFTVEPFLICFVLSTIIPAVAVNKINLEKACRVELGYSEDICTKVINDDTDRIIIEDAHVEANNLVTDMQSWQFLLESSAQAIIVLFAGAWSDRTGNRKALMLISISGKIFFLLGMIISIYFFPEWPLWVTAAIELVPTALSGGPIVAMVGSFAYLADVTTIELRTFRIGIASVIVIRMIPFAESVSGFLVRNFGYYGVFGIGLAINVIGFLYAWWRIQDVNKVAAQGTFLENLKLFFHPKNIVDTLSVIFSSRGRGRAQIIWVICAHIVIAGPAVGEANILYLYANQEFDMTVDQSFFFVKCNIFLQAMGTAVAVTVFSRILKIHDTILGMIATSSRIASSLVYGLAPTKQWLYAGLAFGFFGNSTPMRSLGTKLVEPENIAKMCSLIGIADAIISMTFGPMYQNILSNIFTSVPGATYFFSASMTAHAFVILIALYTLLNNQERNTVKSLAEKEMYNMHVNTDTCVTTF